MQDRPHRCLTCLIPVRAALRRHAGILGALALFFSGPAAAQLVINEIDYDQASTDTAEFVELKNVSGAPVDLTGYSLELVNGNGGGAVVYDTIALPSISLAAGDYFVVCANAATVANCDLDDGPDENFLQNGSPDAVGLRNGAAVLIDALSYEGDSGAPYTEGSGAGLEDDPSFDAYGLSRSPDGMDTNQNNADFSFCPVSPGAANLCGGVDNPPEVTGTTPADGSTGIAPDANIVITFSEDVTVTDPWFEIHCSSSGSHDAAVTGGPQNYTLDPATDFALSESCTVNVFAAQVTDQDGTADNLAEDYVFGFDTNPVVAAELVINEIDYDQPGTDAAEFVEILNKGATPVDLAGFSLVLINGSNDAPYKTIDLPSHLLPAGGYYVVCGDAGNVYNCDLDVSPDTNLIQNGSPDGVALYAGTTLLDTVSYEGDLAAPWTETSGSGLEDPSSPPYLGISRTPDGADTNVNNVDFSQRCITPGFANSLESTGCVDPTPPPLRINEIDYDQPGTDAAEFVEIINAGNAPADLDGVSLVLVNGSNDTPYQTFALPAVMLGAGDYYVVCANAATVANCDLDVSPDTNLVQNGSPDAVALVRAGAVLDTVSYEGDVGAPYTEGSGSGLSDSNAAGQDNLGISRFPNGNDTNQNNVDLVYACITPGLANTSLDTNCSSTGPVREIYEIQGSGSASPYAGQGIATMDNIVTAVGTDGFFMQTPDARADADVNTSNGIFVFTGAAPAVAVGDQVNVSGSVTEFFDFTEFAGGSSVVVTSSGNALPTATVFDDTVPSPDPMAPSCAIEFECYEGMLVQITGGTVTGPNQNFGSDPVAEVYITAAGERTFREPGIQFPGLFGYPEWDGNPEVFELDPDKLGLPNQVIPAGSTFDAIGALGYEFGGYELWPSSLNVTPAPLPAPVRAREAAEMTVGALNLYRLFDDIDDAPIEVRDPDTNVVLTVTDDEVLDSAEYAGRLAKFSAYIRGVLDAPDILAVSEVESLKVLQDLADTIASDDASVNYTPYLEEGNDVGGIDVGFLVRDSVVVDKVTQLGRYEFLSVDGSLLNDRPPLLLEGRQVADGSDFPIAVMAIHGRSLSSIESSDRVRQKRLEQAQFVAMQVQALQDANPDINLVLAGDFNAYEFSDGYVDVTGFMKGSFTAADNLVCETNPCTDHVSPDLIDQVLMIDAGERYSFIFAGNAQALDHALTSSGLDELVRDFQYGRGNSDAAVGLIDDASTPLRSSDHDGLVLFLAKDSDGDGVTDDADYCPGTVIPESVPTETLGTNRFALTDDDRVFDTSYPKGAGPGADFDIFDTGGCSCEQIVVEQDLGKGHLKFGCSLGEMEDWVELINLP
jgi:predicted extracellular nuclease